MPVDAFASAGFIPRPRDYSCSSSYVEQIQAPYAKNTGLSFEANECFAGSAPSFKGKSER